LRISRNKFENGLLLRVLARAGYPNGARLMDFISFPAAKRDCREGAADRGHLDLQDMDFFL
jgi:hypothetical protein